MKKNMILHSGPPVEWENMCPPQRGGVIGALIYEELADSPAEAEKMTEEGEITLEPCHQHQTVGSMSGITSPSMPVFVVKNLTHNNLAFHQLYDGPSHTRLTMGSYNDELFEHLKWLRESLAPALSKSIRNYEEIKVKQIIARALSMGDECHNRCIAGTSRFVMEMTFRMLNADVEKDLIEKFVEYSIQSENSFLYLVMPACKAMADAAHGIEYSTMVTAMARNGTEFGIRVSGLGDRWFTAPSPRIDGFYFPGFKAEDANPDMGDSSITETVGLGGFAMAASPAIVRLTGGTVRDAIRYTRDMREITLTKNSDFAIPYMDFEGTPTGIDIRKIVETGIVPVIDTGIAHKKPDIGHIGAGITKAPLECFKNALMDFFKKVSG
jgi:hypothetical protein